MPRGSGKWVNSPGQVTVKKITVTHTQLQAAALINDITFYTLAAKEVVKAVYIKHSVAFAGGTIVSYTLSIGIVGALTKYLAAKDVFTAIGDTVQYGLLTAAPLAESHANGTALRLSAIAVGANLDQSTAGSVDIWLETVTLP